MKPSNSVLFARARIITTIVVLTALAAACPLPVPPGSAGALVIHYASSPRNVLVPEESLDVDSIDVEGSGPSAQTFSLPGLASDTTTTGRLYLAVGTWTVTGTARNDQGTAIAGGSTEVEIVTGEEAQATLTLLPLTGLGSISITASWPAGIVSSPAVEAILTPSAGGGDVELTVALDTTSGIDAELTNPSVPAGSYLLTVVLDDGAAEVGRGVGVVQVAEGMSTTGSIQFLYDPEQGALQIDFDVPGSLSVTLQSELPETLSQGDTLTVEADVNAVGATVTWYRNGWIIDGQTSTSLSVSTATWPKAQHQLTVIVTEAGRSAAASFNVTIL